MDLSAPHDFGWRGRWIMWRNGILSDPRFQRFASRFPLTRPIARRRARALFDLVAGFTYSQILAACIQTGLLERLADGPLTSSQVAERIGLPESGADRLLRGAAALGLVESLGDGWALGSDGAALLGNAGIAAMVDHHHLLYADLADPVALLKRGGGGGALSGLWHYAEAAGEGDAEAVAAYSGLMAASQPLVADMAIDSYPFARHRRLLDVGGGEGVFLTAMASRVPQLELGLFDLESVAARARMRLDAADLATRTTVFGGSFLTDPLPTGFDIITLVRVLHDHDDEVALVLLRAVHAALPEGGKLFIAEPMAQTPGAERSGEAYFGFYLLAMGSGRPRTPAEIATMLCAAGFSTSRLLRTSVPQTVRTIIATR